MERGSSKSKREPRIQALVALMVSIAASKGMRSNACPHRGSECPAGVEV